MLRWSGWNFRNGLRWAALLGGVGALQIVIACTCQSMSDAKTDEPELVQRGRAVYMAQCASCHGTDPKSAGTLGPDVHGSSYELLEAKIMKGAYPPGYVPKRKSQAMAPMPHLRDELVVLQAFLNN